MKKCNKCNIIQEDINFYIIKKGKSLHSKCKTCCSIINKENQKTRNKEKKNEYNKKYYSKFKSEISLKNREQKNAYQRDYYHLNKNLIFEKEKDRYNNDINFRLSKIYRNRLTSYIKGENNIMKYLKCDLVELKSFIEIQFTQDMSWENKGTVWELDHVIPISKFNLENPKHIEICFHWCNLKPLYKLNNRKKSNKLIDKMIKTHQEFSLNFSKIHKLHYSNIYNFYIMNLINR